MARARNVYDPPPDAPVVNPFERFTQVDFDDYVGGLRNKIRDALDPRRGLRNRERDSDASFGLGYGEFKFGRSVSVGESSFAASGQSVPRSSVEEERGERVTPYNSDGKDNEVPSDASDQEGYSPKAPKPTVVVSGEGDSESPFVISDDDDEDPHPTDIEALTPRSKAHQLLGLEGADEGDEGDYDDEEEEEEAEEISPLRSETASGPLNPYDDRDDIELVEDDSLEENAPDVTEANPFERPIDGFGGSSSPAWQEHISDGGEAADDSHLQESGNSLDEYFTVDMDHLPPGFSSIGYRYDASEPEMREYSQDNTNPFSQMLAPGLAAGSPFSEGLPQIFPTRDSGALTWQTDQYPSGPTGDLSEFVQPDAVSAEGISQGSTGHEASHRITYSNLSTFGQGGNGGMFASYPTQIANTEESTFNFQFYEPGEVTPTAHEASVPTEMPDVTNIVYGDARLPDEEATHPDSIEEPTKYTLPHYSEEITNVVTPSLTPALSPSGITLTAPDSSLLSDNSSVATSVPVALDPAGNAGGQIGTVEFDNGPEDLTLPDEVTQGLNQDVSLLPDPHRVPEPTSLGTPEGVAGLATRIIETSVWGEPPTPPRSEYADGVFNNTEGNDFADESEGPELPPIVVPQPTSPHNSSRVRWRDQHASNPSPDETPKEELEGLEPELVKPTAPERSVETPQEVKPLLQGQHSLTLPNPIQTVAETSQEERNHSVGALAPPTLTQVSLDTPRGEIHIPEQFLITGGSEGNTPLSIRGTLTRESTMTDATWSQGPVAASPLRHATSVTLTGESYFLSQPISSPSRRSSSKQGETANTVDGATPGPVKHTEGVDQSTADSMSPFSEDSPLSEDGQEPLAPKSTKRAPNRSRLTGSVGIVGKRELNALQAEAGALMVDSGRSRRKPSNKPAVQANKSPTRAKGKQKASPVMKSQPPKVVTTTRLRELRSNSMVSSPISKPTSPTSTTGHEKESYESSRDEIDLLHEADEEAWEKEQDNVEYKHGDEHPKKKRKRAPRVSRHAGDEDYVPDDVERSLKKRKIEAKENDLDQSLDAIDLASVLEMAEADTSTNVQKGKKLKQFKKNKKQMAPEELVEAQSSSASTDRGSEFRLSEASDVEEAPEEPNVGVEIDAEAFQRLSPAAQARFRRLNPDSRAYRPSEESESESEEDDVAVSRANLIADLKDIVEGIEETAKGRDKNGELQPGVPSGSENASTALKRKEKKKRKRNAGGNKSKKADPVVSKTGGDDGMVMAPEKLSELLPEDVQNRDVEMEHAADEDRGDAVVISSNDLVESASATEQPLPQQGVNEGSKWGFNIPFMNRWRTPNQDVAVPRPSPAADSMDVD